MGKLSADTANYCAPCPFCFDTIVVILLTALPVAGDISEALYGLTSRPRTARQQVTGDSLFFLAKAPTDIVVFLNRRQISWENMFHI